MWNKIYVNTNQIDREFSNSLLIKMPNNSEWKGWKFFHSTKLVREGSHSANFSISFTDDWDFRLVKGKDQEMNITALDMLDAFREVKENNELPNSESYLIIEEPTLIDVEVKIKEELKNENNY